MSSKPAAAELIGPAQVLAFWHAAGPERWFKKDADFDAEIAARFGALLGAARKADCSHWEDTPEGALALTIVLDQLPRNIFRGDARIYSGDALARDYGSEEFAKYAEEHADIIRRFGRFPHRNPILGRASTDAERAFLEGGGFSG